MSWLGVSNRSISPVASLATGIAAILEGMDVVSGVSGGAVQQFAYPTGFATGGSLDSNLNLAGGHVAFANPVIHVSDGLQTHEAGGVWYKTRQNIQSFTTTFTFIPDVFGMWFICQNSDVQGIPPSFNGDNAVGDANGEGFGDFTVNNPRAYISQSAGINFGLNANGMSVNLPAAFSSAGICVDGGPDNCFFCPLTDLQSFGINFHAGNLQSCTLVYDGTLLSMVLTDTVTLNAARMSFPINIPAFVLANTAFVGFTAGSSGSPSGLSILNSWTYSTGFNTRLATPVINLASGDYTGTQSVTISGPSGAAIWYSTNGVPPSPNAPNSTLYSGAISVASTQILQAVAIESGSTDSFVAAANYQIGTSLPRVNFPTTFASSAPFIGFAGNCAISGSEIAMTSSSGQDCIGAFWFQVPLDITAFTCVFTMNNPSAGNVNGVCFVMQNQAGSTGKQVANSGGPSALAFDPNQSGLGYVGLTTSAAVIFDQHNGSGDLTGYYTGGTTTTGSSFDMSGSSINLNGGHDFKVTLTYSGTTLVETVEDLTTLATFSKTYTGVNIAAAVGASTAYVGFTFLNSTGGSTQFIKNWTFA